MRAGIRMDDYRVDIGQGVCVNQELHDNELTCIPPVIPVEQQDGEAAQTLSNNSKYSTTLTFTSQTPQPGTRKNLHLDYRPD